MATNSDVSSPFKKVQIERDNSTFDAYVIGRDDAPGIVVLHEWWGVDFEIKNHAQKIVGFDKGYKALIPDLYRGRVGLNAAEAQHLMDSLDWKGAVKDIEASVNWLKAEGSKKVGVTGFCICSALAIASSVLVPGIDAVVSFYGVPSCELADVIKAKAPVQAHFGQLDTFVGFSDVETVRSLQYELWRAGENYENEVFVYKGVGHAFMNRSPEAIERRKRMGINDENAEAASIQRLSSLNLARAQPRDAHGHSMSTAFGSAQSVAPITPSECRQRPTSPSQPRRTRRAQQLEYV
ncbi:alpha/beta-Hydrolases superfamily protein [Striga hermonthica]|uniref:Alpha/beta-Hydrolases superfamily protein n=1 Tax=Striga hermonthica TaxID=68872 RepID=A0A9N7MVX2_STRHE|nr:alpha/beta-Hydrolases superfamily protein [Striga hermonthica]